MKCFVCKGHYETKETTFMLEIEKSIIIIRDVPSQVCAQCGDVSYSTEVTKRLEVIVEAMRHSMTEIAVIHYSADAA